MISKDIQILEHICRYCTKIAIVINEFGSSFDNFKNKIAFQDSISFNILQIGELINHLSKEFIDLTKNQMPWKKIISTRNRIAHAYLSIDYPMIWNSAINGIPKLNAFCNEKLKEVQSPSIETTAVGNDTSSATTTDIPSVPNRSRFKP
jgi:uncharacterized protein with HEPN domain